MDVETTEANVLRLALDPAGNTRVQQRLASGEYPLLCALLAPHAAQLARHKNGTYVAQKMVALLKTRPASEQQQVVAMLVTGCQGHVADLLADTYANYFVQALCQHTSALWPEILLAFPDVALSRYGSRAVRSMVEQYPHASGPSASPGASPGPPHAIVSSVVDVILNHLAVLIVDPNGSILTNWLLDQPNFHAQIVAALCDSNSIGQVGATKLGGLALLKLAQQYPNNALLDAIFSLSNLSFLVNNMYGPSLILKCIPMLGMDQRERHMNTLKQVLLELPAKNTTNNQIKRLMDECGIVNHVRPSSNSMSQVWQRERSISNLSLGSGGGNRSRSNSAITMNAFIMQLQANHQHQHLSPPLPLQQQQQQHQPALVPPPQPVQQYYSPHQIPPQTNLQFPSLQPIPVSNYMPPALHLQQQLQPQQPQMQQQQFYATEELGDDFLRQQLDGLYEK